MKPRAMNPRQEALLRRGVLRMVGGAHPDRRTRHEVRSLDLAHHLPILREGRPVASLQHLPWESSIFHRPCANLHLAFSGNITDLRAAAAFPVTRGLIWTRVSSSHLKLRQALGRLGFEPVLEMVNYELNLFRASLLPEHDGGRTIRPCRKLEAGRLAQMGRAMFARDRFHADSRLPKRAADEAHAQWTLNCARGKLADRTLVAWNGHRMAGFHALKCLDLKEGRVGLTVLIGVRRSQTGKGVGRSLLSAGLKYFSERGARRVWVRTEGANAAARRLYESFGFQETARFWYLRSIHA